jgi:Ca-activated chloride channel homolog
MAKLMRCIYCGCLQDEPAGVKSCNRCGGELAFESGRLTPSANYVQAQLELDQITAPADTTVSRHLILTIRTPMKVPATEAAPTQTGRKPLSFVPVLDVSGSMGGDKLEWAKKAIRQAIQHLHDGDVAALVTFASEVVTVLPPTQVDASLKQRLESFLGDLQAGGQTALDGGLEAGIAGARQQVQDVNLVLLLSDGQANVGEIDLEKVGARALGAAREKITVSSMGIGADYNEALMSEVATQGGGRFYHLQHSHQIAPYVAGELGEASALIARDVRVHLQLPVGALVETYSAAYRVEGAGQIALGNIPADTTLEVALQIKLPAQAAGSQLVIDGHLTYQSPANHSLEAPLNPVTIRYIESEKFNFREGAVTAVVEQVLNQMYAADYLRTSRATGQAHPNQAQVNQIVNEGVANVEHYATLLGEEHAKNMAKKHRHELDQMQASPAMAKARVASGHRLQRSSKDFDNK